MHTKSTLRATAPVFHPSSHTSTPTNTTGTHSGPPTPYITPVEPYQAHPVTYVQIGPYQHVPLYIYHQVRGIYIGSRFQPQQEQYFYSHVPLPPQPPISPASAGYEWWPGAEGEGAWAGSEQGGSGFKNGYGGGYGFGGYGGRKFKNFKQGYGKKGYGGKKKGWGFKGKKGGRFADDQVTLAGRDSAVFG